MAWFGDYVKWIWSDGLARSFFIFFFLIAGYLIIREINYEKWYGEEVDVVVEEVITEPVTETVVDTLSVQDTLQ